MEMACRLLRAARESIEPSGSQRQEDIINSVRDEHIAAAKSYLSSSESIDSLSRVIVQECEDLSIFLAAARRIGEISPKSIDTVISKGEILSAHFVAALLQDRGICSEFIDLSSIFSFTSHQILDRVFYSDLATALARKVASCGDKVPVVTGYFGTIPGGLLSQIGRGYTDLCAALVAVGLQANELQIWKEVDGIFTADPRKVPTARLVASITPAEAAELTFYGSEVIHPFTMEQVIEARIPIRIKNVMNPRNPGTIIAPEPAGKSDASVPGHDSRHFRMRSASVLSDHQRPKRPTAITIKPQILVINVHSNKRSLSHGFFANIFSVLDKWRLSVDLISTSEVHVSMALHSDSPMVSRGGDDEREIVDYNLRGAITELRQYGTADWIDGMAILSLVGKQMKHMMGVAGKMFSVLGENNVNIEMISQGMIFDLNASGAQQY